jgi:cytoskeletal protein RodZ
VGETLRRAREAKKLTIEQVHDETKISVEVIESLEQEDFASFDSETYLRGFLRNYAAFLGLDASGLWSRLPRGDGEKRESAETFWDVEESVHEERLESSRVFRRFVLPVLILIIVVLSVLLVREHRKVKSLTTGALSRGAVTLVAEL